jgi:hemin uptake protein HemP
MKSTSSGNGRSERLLDPRNHRRGGGRAGAKARLASTGGIPTDHRSSVATVTTLMAGWRTGFKTRGWLASKSIPLTRTPQEPIVRINLTAGMISFAWDLSTFFRRPTCEMPKKHKKEGFRGHIAASAGPASGQIDAPEATPQQASGPLSISSENLLAGRSEVQILHRGEIYRLTLTRAGKLILHK